MLQQGYKARCNGRLRLMWTFLSPTRRNFWFSAVTKTATTAGTQTNSLILGSPTPQPQDAVPGIFKLHFYDFCRKFDQEQKLKKVIKFLSTPNLSKVHSEVTKRSKIPEEELEWTAKTCLSFQKCPQTPQMNWQHAQMHRTILLETGEWSTCTQVETKKKHLYGSI